MAMPRQIIGFHRTWDQTMRGLAVRLPTMAVMHHTGRKSGREHRTALNVFRSQSGYVIAILHGRDSHWVQNVMAMGSCDVVTMGKRVHVVHPRIVGDEPRRLLPPPWRLLFKLLKVKDFLLLESDTPSKAA